MSKKDIRVEKRISGMNEVNNSVNTIYRDRVDFWAVQNPLTKKVEVYQLKIPSKLHYVDRIIQFIMKKVFNVLHTHKFDNAIRMALIEALTNAIEHGNKFDIKKKVQIQFRVDEESFWANIIDEGEGFNPKAIAGIQKANEEFSDRGRGIFIIKRFMDRVWFNKKGNAIYIKKYFNKMKRWQGRLKRK